MGACSVKLQSLTSAAHTVATAAETAAAAAGQAAAPGSPADKATRQRHLAAAGRELDSARSATEAADAASTTLKALTALEPMLSMLEQALLNLTQAAPSAVEAADDDGYLPLLFDVISGPFSRAVGRLWKLLCNEEETLADAISAVTLARDASLELIDWRVQLLTHRLEDLEPGCWRQLSDKINAAQAEIEARKGKKFRNRRFIVLQCQACISKQLLLVPTLLDFDARAGVVANNFDDVELHYAAANSGWTGELVHQVIKAGCPLNSYNGTKGSGCTPLVLAASKNNIKVVRALVAAGADLDLPDKTTSMTALHYAASGGYMEIVEALIGV
eukprot:gene4228-4477_t